MQIEFELYDLPVSGRGIYLPSIQFASSLYILCIVTGEIKIILNHLSNYAHLNVKAKDVEIIKSHTSSL